MFMTERHQHARAGRIAYLADVDPKRDRLDDLHVADEPALVELQVFAFDAKRAPDKAVGAVDPDKISSAEMSDLPRPDQRAVDHRRPCDFNLDAFLPLLETYALPTHSDVGARFPRAAVERGFKIGLPLREVGIVA